MGLYGKHSILGANARHPIVKYNLNCNVVENKWRELCTDQSNVVRVSEQIKELCFMRDTRNTGVLSMSDTKCIIEMLCTT